MKEKRFTTIIFCAISILFIIILIIFLKNIIKNKKSVNTINIQSKEKVEEYIFNINEYEAKLDVKVFSNKNENLYEIKQVVEKKHFYQEILNNQRNNLVIEHLDNKVIIKNNSLKLEKVYENYECMLENTLYLNTFIDEYKKSEEKEITEDNDYYIVKIKLSDNKNKYVLYKNLYIGKKDSKPKKMEIEDINKNRTIYILYKEITIK
ncbi:MAG: hypothetical protein HFJ43_01130 [Clostridia bacterium]|nr:hypothetical protein [Clostridia bacterium]